MFIDRNLSRVESFPIYIINVIQFGFLVSGKKSKSTFYLSDFIDTLSPNYSLYLLINR